MDILCQVNLPHISGFAEDTVVNNFAVKTAAGWTGDPFDELGEVTIPLAQIYTAANGLGDKVGSHIGTGISRVAGACTIKLYDLTGHLDGSPHGSPMIQDTFTMPGPGTDTTLPEEVALALTLRASGWAEAAVEVPDGPDAGPEVDRPRARHTGKIYFGPFTTDSLVLGTGEKARPTLGTRTVILDAVERENDNLLASGHTLCVWSRKFAGLVPITDIQIDDAWDTQRRRGPDPTVRTTRNVA